MTDEHQLTLGSSVFGQDLQERVAAAREIQDQAGRLLVALNEQRDGEWQPVALDRPHHYAECAIQQVGDDERYRSYLEAARESLAAARWTFDDVELEES